MVSMRQRLLLVAGWVTAAVVSGLVASGAVAVAGGQVLDRPLRPLTAAEVAALPVVRSVGSSEPSEPLASGGSDSTTGAPTNGSVATTVGTDGENADPAGTGGAAVAEFGGEPVAESPEALALRLGRDHPVSVVRVTGGSASIAAIDGRLTVLWATPQPGFVVSLAFDAEDHLTLLFTSHRKETVLEATWDGEELLIETGDITFR